MSRIPRIIITSKHNQWQETQKTELSRVDYGSTKKCQKFFIIFRFCFEGGQKIVVILYRVFLFLSPSPCIRSFLFSIQFFLFLGENFFNFFFSIEEEKRCCAMMLSYCKNINFGHHKNSLCGFVWGEREKKEGVIDNLGFLTCINPSGLTIIHKKDSKDCG